MTYAHVHGSSLSAARTDNAHELSNHASYLCDTRVRDVIGVSSQRTTARVKPITQVTGPGGAARGVVASPRDEANSPGGGVGRSIDS